MAQRVESWLRRSAGLAVAVFILLSATGGECLQCYWCGPRAEQVHRSQRAPSCDEVSNQVTACEPEYTYCAVVATSPPFAESRHCVKLYQDECYSRYCNSTRSYIMTCPCRGDLCNGPNTEREIEAFAALSRIVAKGRVRRNSITSSNFISAGKPKINNLIDTDDEKENTDDDETKNETNENVKQTEPPAAGLVEKSNDDSVGNATEIDTTPEAQTELVKTVESTTDPIKEMPIAMEVVSTAESLKIDLTTTKAPETLIKPAETMQVKVNELVSNDIKTSMQLPTAEALQQNGSPVITTEKTMEQTTGPVTLMTTTEQNYETPTPTKSKNNSAVASVSTFIILSNLVFNFSS